MTLKSNDYQVGGSHYKSKFQHWDFVELLGLPYMVAQVTRYLSRWRKKSGPQDVEKALHYMDKFMEGEASRLRQARLLLENFIRENELDENEQIVFNMLVNYHLGDEDRLFEAREAIVKLQNKLATQVDWPDRSLRAAVLQQTVAADPKFEEDADEWKR